MGVSGVSGVSGVLGDLCVSRLKLEIENLAKQKTSLSTRHVQKSKMCIRA